ncbi:hypothetical protein BDV26DRAFT_293442 [Aspergillus bertholletiae]|uniref:Uncharacterized protein n=1 Tax=Aspergillus bertholletiae TaxID=1226010 RepID=A0A5N7B6X5_9EURO|nr:hypothetical protein BDV26DRAFT_293442 [Aspergillus bertholletiae]
MSTYTLTEDLELITIPMKASQAILQSFSTWLSLLLEINFGMPIEEIRCADDLGNQRVVDDMTDLQTANRWFRDSKSCLSHAFQRAILTCLQGHLNPDADPNDPEYYKVLKTSYCHWKMGCGISWLVHHVERGNCGLERTA